jgi:hypothetical protein
VVDRVISLSRYKVFRPLVRDAERLIRDYIVPEGMAGADAADASPSERR